jgi:hypothetical protein
MFTDVSEQHAASIVRIEEYVERGKSGADIWMTVRLGFQSEPTGVKIT